MITIPADATPAVQAAFLGVRDALVVLQRPWSGPGNLDAKGRRVINAGRAIDPFDYVTRADLDDAIETIPDPEALPLPEAMIRYGTHSERIALGPGRVDDGTFFYETDRATLYQAQWTTTPVWMLVMSRPLRTADAKPSDLTANDEGFTWFDQVAGVTWRWSGAAWHYYLGSLIDVFANRPTTADRGFLFIATDRGGQVWRNGVTAWVLLEGVGGPYSANAGSAPTLTTDDVGFVWKMADFDRLYRWTGTAWEDAAGQPTRGMIDYFSDLMLPGAWWALCDGSSVTRSTPTGGTTSILVPNLTSVNRFIRSVALGTGTTGGGATTHTHQVNPPSTTSGANSASQAVQVGVGVTVAADPHTHATDVVEFSSGGPSGAGGDDALPPYLLLRPYMRL